MPLRNPFRRPQSDRLTLRQRAASLKAGLARVVEKPAARAPEPQPEAAPDFATQVAQAGLAGGVLAVSGIDHRDGTVSYADATGKVSRRPMAHWVGFNAMQMHAHVQGEIGRRRVIEANPLPGDEHEAWEARIRRELRADAIHALTFRHDRAFEAAEAIRTGVEPATQALREQADAELLALAPAWEAALDLYQRLSDEENLIGETASEEGWPGPAPAGAGPEWRAWFRQKEDWRERTGVASAEEAASEAGTALHEIELQIAALPAASLAGLKLKARVGQRSDDIGVTWPEGLGAGLARDILEFSEAQAAPPKPAIGTSLVDQIDFASASLEDLQALHDIANTVADVASAMAWTGRCHARGWNEQSAPGDHYNAAGKLMQWLGEALADVADAARKEVQRRLPNTPDERETRLTILAGPTIENGDPDEIAALAGELAAHAVAELAGR